MLSTLKKISLYVHLDKVLTAKKIEVNTVNTISFIGQTPKPTALLFVKIFVYV